MDNGSLVVFCFFVSIFVYFVPTVVAVSKGRANAGAIVVLNILLGWTFVGWVVALVWAITDGDTKQDTVNVTVQAPPDTAQLSSTTKNKVIEIE